MGLLVILQSGCPQSDSDTSAENEQVEVKTRTENESPLQVTVIGATDLAEAVRREWFAETSQDIQLVTVDASAVDIKAIRGDVIIFPPRLLGTLVTERIVVPWPLPTRPELDGYVGSASETYRWSDILPWLRRQELQWNNEPYGVSFGSPQFLLVYRKDLFRRWGLELPRTWNEYHLVAQQIQERLTANPNASPPLPSRATAEPLGESWAGYVLLARTAPYVKHADQLSAYFQFGTMKPLIDEPPFVRAMDELLSVSPMMLDQGKTFSPADTMAALLQNQVAMAITWPSPARSPIESLDADAEFGFAPLPGSSEIYRFSTNAWEPSRAESIARVPLLGISGMMGSVARRARSVEHASSFLMWLTSTEQATRISTRSEHTTLYRETQLTQANAWVESTLAPASGMFASAIAESQQSANALQALRLPGQEEYMIALHEAVRQVVAGSADSQTALRQAATYWKEITSRRGKDEQQAASLESLGLQVD